MAPRRSAVALLALLAGACTPDGRGGGGGSGVRTSRARDASGLADGSTARDGAVNAADASEEIDAGHDDAGEPIDASQPAFCGDGRCDPDETCSTCAGDCGACACDPGFVTHAGRCVPNAPAPFRDRTEQEVCDRWRQDFVSGANEWSPTPGSSDPCDPGVLDQAAHDNAILRTNLYRWLAGLGTVGEDASLREAQQACAVLQKAMGGLEHTPAMNAPCWSSAGAQGAGSSNLAYGSRDLASSVDLYVGDRGVASLGHRRWVLNPQMQETTFGYKPTFSCMYAFSRGGPANVEYVAWPPPGYVPVQAARGTWSFSSATHVASAGTRVELASGGGPFVETTHRDPGGNYGWGRVMAFDPAQASGDLWRAGTTVRVALRGTARGDVEYTVRFVDCN